ncbi:MAG: hypothetical protein M3548_13360 [Actinomycetota bacterium]|nr:hypothetical protein [Actinomycetota bacterium]
MPRTRGENTWRRLSPSTSAAPTTMSSAEPPNPVRMTAPSRRNRSLAFSG